MFRKKSVQSSSYVYILTNQWKTTLYIGVTNDLFQTIVDHKERKNPDSFTARYNCDVLVYYEVYNAIQDAIQRQHQLKGWERSWQEDLINQRNTSWKDLFGELKRLGGR